MTEKIVQVKNKFKDNLKGQLILLFCLNIFDLLATTLWIVMFGTEVEGNPIARVMFEQNTIYFYKTVMVGAMELILYKAIQKYPKWMWSIWFLIAVYSGIAIYHLFLGVRLMMIMSGLG